MPRKPQTQHCHVCRPRWCENVNSECGRADDGGQLGDSR